MGRILSLDRNMINMIAAGEVIERPASVAKELMENSIDSGATKITVSIEDGGRKLIAVVDNGCGMEAEDLCQAFESHSTSKIKNISDLQGISTLGFRGEALASIASVAMVKATSRIKQSDSGNCVEMDCGNKEKVSPCSCDYGTTIEVRDLFYKLPARRKFLRTANTEFGHISEQFTRIALSNNGIEMKLLHNGRELYHLGNDQGIRQRIGRLFSTEICENLLETEQAEKKTHIFALLGRPEISRANNKLQYVFLNGRFIRDKFISHAIKEAYRGNLEPGRFPVAFLFIQMPHEDLDVNVHPTKIEVRFYNANLVHSQILGALRERLLGAQLQTRGKLTTALDLEKSGQREKVTEAMSEFFKKHNSARRQPQFNFSTGRTSGTAIADRNYRTTPAPEEIQTQTQLCGKILQVHDRYILTEQAGGFVIIDQHALHERILYEKLLARIKNEKLQSQRLLVPESFELTDAQADKLNTNSELIEKLGIELVPFGPKSWACHAFPTILQKAQPVDFIHDLIDLLCEKDIAEDSERLLNEVISMAACKGAIKAGQKLTEAEMQQLISDSKLLESSNRCPHGRPTTIKFSFEELEKQFKRT